MARMHRHRHGADVLPRIRTGCSGSREHSPTAPAAPTANTAMELTPIRATARRYIALAPDAAMAIVAPPEYRAPQAAPTKLLESVPLDAETQAAIYDVCGQDPELFAAVMAIADQESDFDPDTIGDSGNSIGMMQINTRWQAERVKALGITDLTDPVQSATVAVDYLRELSEDYGLGWVHDHSLYMGYNMGPGGAKRALRRGSTSSAYSREVMPSFDGYLGEMEGK